MKALALLALAACGSGSTYRTTRLAPPGHTEWLFGAQVSGAGTVGVDEGGGQGGIAPLPELAASVRYGLDERFELQANSTILPTAIAQTGSLELAGKLASPRAAAGHSRSAPASATARRKWAARSSRTSTHRSR